MSIGNYWKVVFGYNESDYISIYKDELAKAIVLFMEGGKAVFEEGAIRGQDITRIVPDWHTEKGWNKGWKMTPNDYDHISQLERPYSEIYNSAKLLAETVIKENKRDLLNLPLETALQQIASPREQKQIDGLKKLADKFKINH